MSRPQAAASDGLPASELVRLSCCGPSLPFPSLPPRPSSSSWLPRVRSSASGLLRRDALSTYGEKSQLCLRMRESFPSRACSWVLEQRSLPSTSLAHSDLGTLRLSPWSAHARQLPTAPTPTPAPAPCVIPGRRQPGPVPSLRCRSLGASEPRVQTFSPADPRLVGVPLSCARR